jgi:hypothetical protein
MNTQDVITKASDAKQLLKELAWFIAEHDAHGLIDYRAIRAKVSECIEDLEHEALRSVDDE